ncbi:MAG: InlB B-repeat-containing protein, partial [Clostridia bacterium]|nr:InlB B-repeat-containing protein [Clostridia bacterium]
KAALSSSMPVATRSGYTFNGWYCSSIGLTLTTSNWTNTFSANTNLTFVAQWTQNAATKYTITFDNNVGSITSGSKTNQIEYGQTYADAIGTLPVATRSGYTFNGWYCEKYNFTLTSAGMGNYWAVQENATFVAQWISNSTVGLTLNAGPCGNGATKTLSLTTKTLYHDKASIYSNYGLLPSGGSSDQRVFMGWYTGYDAKTGRGTGTMYWDTYSGSGNETLYAIWGYPIVLNADGGTYNDGSQRYISYVANYAPWNGADDSTDPMSRYVYMLPDLFGNDPVKCNLEREQAPAYALITASGDIYTMEGTAQNLTLPPTGGVLPWSSFRCTSTVYGTALEFVAIWKPTVSYNANGGSGTMATDTLTPSFDGGLYLYENYSVRGNTFTKSNATFTGWNTKADGTGKSYSAGQTINQLSSSDPITLYAQWSDGSSSGGTGDGYTITLNANGGSPSKTYTIKDGQKYTAVIGSTMPKPTKTNAVFNGWYNADYDFWLLDSSAATFYACKDITFYAQWEEYETFSDPGSGSYKLTFDPNGGTMKTAKTFTINVGQTYLDAIGGFPFATKFGYTLDYWLMEEFGFGLTRSNMAGNYMTAEAAGNYTLVAQWTYVHGHSCVYKDVRTIVTPTCTAAGSKLQACLCGNTKTVALSATSHSYTVDWGTIPATCLANAKTQKKCANCEAVTTTEQSGTKIAHSYGDWVDQGNGKSVRICTFGCGTTETKNNVYNITYLDKNGATFSGTLNASTKYTHTYGTATTLYNPTKSGYAFGGWFTTPDCSGTKVTSLGASAYTSDITLYALWTTNSYTITYYRSDANTTAVTASWMPEGYPTAHIYDYDTVLPTEVNRPGWTFNGWYTKTTYTDEYKVEVLDGQGYTAAIKLYGYFTPNTYSITYYDEGGLPFSGEHLSGQYTEFVYNTAYTLKKATKTGYTFAGWYTDPECTVSIGTSLAKNTYDYDLNLYCKWTPVTSTITYRVINSTSGFGATYMPEGYPTNHTYDQDTVLVYPERTGYTFNGWYSDKAGTTPI